MLNTVAHRVLIVEDDAGVARLQQRALERTGFPAVVASTADEARVIIERSRIDLIVLDYRLDERRTGLDFFNELKAAGYDLPVIIVTGFSQESTVIHALREGVRDFVTKSADYLDYLPEAVRRVLKQVETEKRLTESEAKFRSVSESAVDGIVAIDAFGTIVSWNGGASIIFGYSADELIGQSIERLMPKPYRAAHRQGLERARSTGVLRLLGKPVELQGLRKDGTEFPFEVCLGSWQNDGEWFFSGIIRDITGRKQTEEALHQRNEELRQSQKMQALGTLAGGVAHEFNNLLQAILGYTRFAMEGLDQADSRWQDMSQVLSAADRAASLTRQLLGFGRRQTLERSAVDPNQIVSELVKMLRPLIATNIEIVVELDDELPTIHADAGQLQQVLLNLCLNARDAMPSGGKLTIKTATLTTSGLERQSKPQDNPVAILVSDTGCGMSAKVKQRIFEPFFTTKEVGKGTGLGLAVAYSIVKQHGGELFADSKLGQGSTFKVTLPLSRVLTSENKQQLSPSIERGSELILIAEDELLVNGLAVRVLEGAGYRTLSATNGEEATRYFEENCDTIALALLDVTMPKMSGYEVYRAIQSLRPGTPVCVCSGHVQETTHELLSHDVEVLQKPLEPAALLAAVRRALDSRGKAEGQPIEITGTVDGGYPLSCV